MDEYQRLWAFTEASHACYGLSRRFIERYSTEPQFSRFLTAAGQPYCQPAANSQADYLLHHAGLQISRIESSILEWHNACDAEWWVKDAVCDSEKFPLININGESYVTAHEAAVITAEAVVAIWRSIEGNDIEASHDLARKLSEFLLLGLYGRIEAEKFAAGKLIPVGEDEGDDGLVTIKEITAIAGLASEQRVRNLAVDHPLPSPAVPKAGTIAAKFRYSEILKWAEQHWPARKSEFPATFAEAQKKLGIAAKP